MIKTERLFKTYGKGASAYQALKGINVSIQDGESVAVLGKSGSGKSTLMHLLAGLDSPTSGAIFLNQSNLAAMSEQELSEVRNQKFGFVFQQYFLQPNLSVLQNVEMPLIIRGVADKLCREKALKALQEVELTDKKDNLAVNLSGGQKQRVAIARALVGDPEILFADEPTGNLDTETGLLVMQLLFDLQKRNNITLIVVTHDSDIAAKCNRTISIKDGKLI